MNQRTMELWKQATEHAFSVTTLNETPKEWEDLKLAKFAELIIEETHEFITDEIGNDHGVPFLDNVKTHFGVE